MTWTRASASALPKSSTRSCFSASRSRASAGGRGTGAARRRRCRPPAGGRSRTASPTRRSTPAGSPGRGTRWASSSGSRCATLVEVDEALPGPATGPPGLVRRGTAQARHGRHGNRWCHGSAAAQRPEQHHDEVPTPISPDSSQGHAGALACGRLRRLGVLAGLGAAAWRARLVRRRARSRLQLPRVRRAAGSSGAPRTRRPPSSAAAGPVRRPRCPRPAAAAAGRTEPTGSRDGKV